MLNLCSFEQAQRLKKAGFDWETKEFYQKNNPLFVCFITYKYNHNDNDDAFGHITAPTVALALKWFRDEKGIRGFVLQGNRKNYKIFADFDNGVNSGNYNLEYNYFDTYEAAESTLLDELLNILEKK